MLGAVVAAMLVVGFVVRVVVLGFKVLAVVVVG